VAAAEAEVTEEEGEGFEFWIRRSWDLNVGDANKSLIVTDLPSGAKIPFNFCVESRKKDKDKDKDKDKEELIEFKMGVPMRVL